ATFYVSPLTRRRVTVARNGDGGDGSFAGYGRYRGNLLAERLRRVPGGAWPARTLSRMLPGSLGLKNPLRDAKRFLSVAAQPMAQRYSQWIGYFGEAAKQPLDNPYWRAALPAAR